MKYTMVTGIGEALERLSCGNTRVIAGGTDLVLDLKSGKVAAEELVDITRIEALHGIRRSGARIELGSCVLHAEACRDPLILADAPALAEGCRAVGSAQIRNVATVGGNLVSAQPAADSAVPLAAYEAVCTVSSAEGVRQVPLAELYAGFGKSTVNAEREILTAISFEADTESEGSAYERLAQRSALALPMLCTAVRLGIRGDGIVTRAVITMAPVGVGPVRAEEAEQYLIGKHAAEEVFREAGMLAVRNANPRDSAVRGSREYRLQTLPVLVFRALTRAAERIAEKRRSAQ